MLTLGPCLALLLLALIPLGFPVRRIALANTTAGPKLNRGLLWLALTLHPIFLSLTELGLTVPAAGTVICLYLAFYRRVLLEVDWLLLVVFTLMFIEDCWLVYLR